jgi:spermidine/putrescine transport system ATP-binding protein
MYLGAGSQVMLRLASGGQLQALIQNDSDVVSLAPGTPVHCYLPPDALRVLADPGSDDALAPADEPLTATA